MSMLWLKLLSKPGCRKCDGSSFADMASRRNQLPRYGSIRVLPLLRSSDWPRLLELLLLIYILQYRKDPKLWEIMAYSLILGSCRMYIPSTVPKQD